MEQSEIEFTSFSWKRLIAAIFLLSVGIMDFIIFQPLYGRHVPTGSIMTFEGPSYFVSAGLIPFIVGIGLMIYVILSYFKGKIIHTRETFTLIENRYFMKDKTVIKKEDILLMRLTNNEIGIKYLWLFLFVPYLIYNYYYMILNFNQPFIMGLVNITALFTLISMIVSLLALIILFGFPQWFLEIYTSDGRFESWFEPFKERRKKIEALTSIFDALSNEKNSTFETSPLKTFNKFNLFCSLFFLFNGGLNVVLFMTTFAVHQTLVSHFLIILGAYLLSKELRKTPFPHKFNKPQKESAYIIKSHYYQTFIFTNKGLDYQPQRTLEWFEVFWFTCSTGLYISVPFKIFQNFLIINSQNQNIIMGNLILDFILGFITLLLLTLLLFKPSEKICYKDRKFIILYPLLKSNQEKPTWKASWKKFKRQYKRRIYFIVTCIIISIMILLWQYFFYFNLFNIFNF
ncbi:MAG: hypothetical protein ACTSXH_03670 [Promethearchaeota archaeon]